MYGNRLLAEASNLLSYKESAQQDLVIFASKRQTDLQAERQTDGQASPSALSRCFTMLCSRY